MKRDPDGDAERMRSAIEANGRDLLAYLERRVVPREDAADVLSETMIAAWTAVARLPRESTSARMWLFRVAANTLKNHRRGAARRLAASERLRALISTDATAEHADPNARTDLAFEVRAAISALPSDLAELVRLVHWDGFALVEAAELMRIPAGTARSRYSRARALLAAALRDAPTDAALPLSHS